MNNVYNRNNPYLENHDSNHEIDGNLRTNAHDMNNTYLGDNNTYIGNHEITGHNNGYNNGYNGVRMLAGIQGIPGMTGIMRIQAAILFFPHYLILLEQIYIPIMYYGM